MSIFPGTVPIYKPGTEPLPPGVTEDDRQAFEYQQKLQRFMQSGMENCVTKAAISAGAGNVQSHTTHLGSYSRSQGLLWVHFSL